MKKYFLAEIVTKDQLVHQGIYYAPKKQGTTAVLWVHGLTGKFYSDPAAFSLFVDACEQVGFGFASFNNRGHDYVTDAKKLDKTNPKGYEHVTVGASVETFTDCVFDIDAALSFLVDQGYSRVVLVGHSTGANKVCYYAGTQKDTRIAGVVLAGPMSDRYAALADETRYKKHAQEIDAKLAQGKGDELLAGYDFFPLTPSRWKSLLGEKSEEDVFNYRDQTGALHTFSRIVVPLLVVFGQQDEYADAPIPVMQAAFDAHATSTNYKSVVIPEADHGFTGREKEFSNVIFSWIASI